MKILGKNVVIGTKKICTEYTSKINDESEDCVIGSREFKGKDLEKNILFIRDKKGYLIELKDLEPFPNFALICFGAAQRWKTSPDSAGDYYVDDVKPYFSQYDQETLYDIKTLISILKVYNRETKNLSY